MKIKWTEGLARTLEGGKPIGKWTEGEKCEFICEALDAGFPDLLPAPDIWSAIQGAVKVEREACAKLAECPYGDEVKAYGLDEPKLVGEKIARAIRERGGHD